MADEKVPSRLDLQSRARVAFMKQGDSELVAMNKATKYYNDYQKQKVPKKKKKGLFGSGTDTANVVAKP